MTERARMVAQYDCGAPKASRRRAQADIPTHRAESADSHNVALHRKRLKALRGVMSRVVHERTDGVGRELLFRVQAEEGLQGFCLLNGRI
jgi:hypothetical protein